MSEIHTKMIENEKYLAKGDIFATFQKFQLSCVNFGFSDT